MIQANEEVNTSEALSQGRDLRRNTDINDEESFVASPNQPDSVPSAAQSSNQMNESSNQLQDSTLEYEDNVRRWLVRNNVTLGGRFILVKRVNSRGKAVLELINSSNESVYTPTSKLALQLLGEEYGTDFRLQIVYAAENKSAFFA